MMTRSLTFLACCALLLASAAGAEPVESNVVELTVPDVNLVDQHGERDKFVSGIIGDRLAVITFTFSNCATICPALHGIFGKLQDRIGDDLGKGTVMLTVSVDPIRDIPERLEHHALHHKAKPGWSFLTGEKTDINRLLKAVEVYSPDILDHPPTVFVVDGRRGVWTRLYGFPPPSKITEVLDSYRSARSRG